MGYSHYEKRILRELARDLTDLAPALQKIIVKLQNLLVIVRSGVYIPSFNGSFSIKDVAPALCGATYSDLDLDIRDGSTASAVYLQLIEKDNRIFFDRKRH